MTAQSQEQDQDATTTTAEKPMLMVVTLKSGAQLRSRVSEYTVRRNGLGELVGLKWQAAEDNDVSIEHLVMEEVAAVHTEWAS